MVLVHQLPMLCFAVFAAVLHHVAALAFLQGGPILRLVPVEDGAVGATNWLRGRVDFEGRVDNACGHP